MPGLAAGSISAALGVLSTTDEAKTLAGSVVNSVNALASAASQVRFARTVRMCQALAAGSGQVLGVPVPGAMQP